VIHYKRLIDKSVEYFTKEEADEMGLEYIPWREATEAGQWILSDDDLVLQVTRVKYITDVRYNGNTRQRKRIYTELAIRYPHSKIPMNIQGHIDTCSYGYANNIEYWWEIYLRKEPALNKILAKKVVLGYIPMTKNKVYTREQCEHFNEVAKKLFGKQYNGRNIRLYFNREEVRMSLQEEIRVMAEKKECTLEEVFDLYKEAKDISREKRDAKGLIMVGDRYASIIGVASKMNPAKRELPATDIPLDELGSGFDAVLADKSE
jgi:hypothetical protein